MYAAPLHDGGVHEIAGGLDAASPDGRLLAFAAHLRRLHVRRAALGAMGRSLLLVAGPAIVVAWLVPEVLWPVVTALASLALATALLAGLRTLGVTDAALLRSGAVSPDGLDVLGDELATWLECHRRARADVPMARWLGEDVAAKLPALTPVVAHIGRRGLGRRRWLVPVVILLLLAWLLTEWLAPPWPGVLGGRPSVDGPPAPGGAGSSGAGSGGAVPAPGTNEEAEPRDPAQKPRDEKPPPQPPPPQRTETPDPVQPEPPAPLLDLPAQQRFIVPEFVGDGPTRRVRMHAAELERAGATAPGASGASGASGAQPPPRSREEFERAAEAAQRSRHVPAEERPMVRRYFELLRQAAK